MGYILLMLLATVVASSSVIAIKLSETPPSWLATARLLIAVGALLPTFILAWRKHHERFRFRDVMRGCWPGLFLGLHFVSWNYGARMTAAGNAALLVNFVPLAMPLLLAVLAREHLGPREKLGTGIALAGVTILVFFDFQLNREYFWGDLVCFSSMIVYASYLVFGRRNRDIPHIVLYLVPVYAWAAVVCAVVALTTERAALGTPVPLREWAIFLYMGLMPTVVGHSLFNFCLKHLRGQQVGLLNQAQFLWASIFAYFLLHELPTPAFYPAAILMTIGAAIALRERRVPPQKGLSGAEKGNPSPPVDTRGRSRER